MTYKYWDDQQFITVRVLMLVLKGDSETDFGPKSVSEPPFIRYSYGCYTQANTMTYKYWDDQQFMTGPLLGKFDVLLRGCYLYKDLPFLRVTFIDVEKSRRVISDGIVHEDDVMAKRTELLRPEVNCTATQPRLLTAYITQPVCTGWRKKRGHPISLQIF